MLSYEFTARRFLSVRSAYNPSFSYDGSKLVFISDISGVPQLWVYEKDVIDQLTPFDDRVAAVRCSPCDDSIAFTMDRGGDERFQLLLLRDGGLTRLAGGDGSINYLGVWSPEGDRIAYTSNTRDVRVFDLHIVDVGTGTSEVWYNGCSMCFAETWTRAGIVVNELESSLNTNLILASRKGAEVLIPHSDEALFRCVRSDPSGKGLYMATNLGREFTGLAYYDLARKSLKFLYESRWDVELVEVSGRGTVAFTVNVDGYSKLFLYEPGDRPVEVRIPEGVVNAMAWSPDGRLAISLSTPTSPSNIYMVDVEKAVQLTHMPMMGLKGQQLSTPKPFRYCSFDGLEVPVLAYKPPTGKPPYPTIIWVHGGPEAQARPSFNPLVQLLAYKGFMVLAPNVRGSTGYGRTYVHMDDVEKRFNALRDVYELAKWAVEEGMARPKLGIIGASYGGYTVLACLAFFPEMWAAGVDIVGIASLVTFLKNTGPWRRRIREREYGSLEEDLEVLERLSPLNYVDRIRAPLLVIHGRNDPRVPVTEALQIVEALKSRGRIVEALILDDEGHGLSKIRNRVRAYTAALHFLEKHVKRTSPSS